MTTERHYPWVRRWAILDDPGAARHSQSRDLPAFRPPRGPQILADLASVPCLVLLGESGMGKSKTVGDECERLNQADLNVFYYDLKSTSDEGRLVRRLFDDNVGFRDLLSGQDEFYLFLDSFDEGQIQLPTHADVLTEEFRERCSDEGIRRRLRLRIACRSADYPETLTSALNDLFGASNVFRCRLLPLEQSDIALAAEENGTDPEIFLQEVADRRAEPLAAVPITLNLLLLLARGGGNLPNQRLDLYENGCLALCEEWSKSRREKGDAKYVGRLSSRQRLMAASRIAALSLFCQRLTIGTEPATPWKNGDDLALRDLTGGTEVVDGMRLGVGEPEVREVLRSPLFVSLGGGRYGWAHQTYAEFLAARYLKARGLGVTQIGSLFGPPGHGGRRIAPQLSATAGWLASMDDQFFRQLTQSDPDTLLNADVAVTSDADKEALVANLLEAYDAGLIHPWGRDPNVLYRPLAYPGIADRLRPVIRDVSKSPLARRAALEMAHACAVRELEPELVERVLDQSENHVVRYYALRARSAIATPTARRALTPVALGQAGDDPDDELKAAAIALVWPDVLATSDLLPALTPSKVQNLIGSYRWFLLKEFMQRLPKADLGIALNWMAKIVTENGSTERIGSFIEPCMQLLDFGLARIDDAPIRRAVAELVVAMARNPVWWYDNRHNHEYLSRYLADSKCRRRLAADVADIINADDSAAIFFICRAVCLVQHDDFDWLLAELQRSVGAQTHETFAEWLILIFDPENHEQFEQLYTAAAELPALAQRLDRVTVCWLDSETTRYRREEHARRARAAAPSKQTVTALEPVDIAVRREITALQAGDVAAWHRLVRRLNRDHNNGGTLPGPAFLDRSPGWSSLGSDTQLHILCGAKSLLENGLPDLQTWRNMPRRMTLSCLDAAKIFFHAWRHDASFIENISADGWRAWAPVILGYWYNGTEEEQAGAELYALCYRKIPTDVIHLLEKRLQVLLSTDTGYVDWDTFLGGQWDDKLAKIVASGARDARLERSSLRKAMVLLLEKHPVAAEHLLAEALEDRARTDDRKVSHAATVIAAALAQDGGRRWAEIWPKIRNNAPLAGAAIQGMLYDLDAGFHSVYRLTALSEDDLADLHIFLAEHYPGKRDEEDGAVGAITESYWARNSIINRLVEAGTEAAVAALDRISREAPGCGSMMLPIIDARQNLRRRRWRPLQPAEFKALIDRFDRRLVRSGDDLLEVLVGSLARLNEKLQGETPRARLLWNMAGGRQGDGRPKDENDLSDYVKGHLEDDLNGGLIGVQREVEIRRAGKEAKGQRTDIHVTAHIPRPHEEDVFDPITVIVEVKGCWNDELQAAMKSQLLDRYMTSSGCRYGIYLVGWFECGAWMEDDQRRSRTPRWAYGEAVEFFEQQAAHLSSDSTRVRSVVLDCRIR